MKPDSRHRNVQHDLTHEEVECSLDQKDLKLFNKIYPQILSDIETSEDEKKLMIFALYLGIHEGDLKSHVYIASMSNLNKKLANNFIQPHLDPKEYDGFIMKLGYQSQDVIGAIKDGIQLYSQYL